MSSSSIIIFGPTGGIGVEAARSASQSGTNVWLAMRDPNKPIPGFTAAFEKEADLTRIHADLTKPSSLTEAVTKSGAKTAFVYAMLFSEDSMGSAFAALKDAGITYIVLLSSYDVSPVAEEARKRTFIPRVHAEIELKLRATGMKYVALRPAYFNTNLSQMKGYKKGAIEMYGIDARHDFIAPNDIGAVAGHLLTSPPLSGLGPEHAIPLCGPKIMSMKEALQVIGEALGNEIQATGLTADEFLAKNPGIPQPMFESLVDVTTRSTLPHDMYSETLWSEAVENIRKFAKKEPTTLREWTEANKEAFL